MVFTPLLHCRSVVGSAKSCPRVENSSIVGPPSCYCDANMFQIVGSDYSALSSDISQRQHVALLSDVPAFSFKALAAVIVSLILSSDSEVSSVSHVYHGGSGLITWFLVFCWWSMANFSSGSGSHPQASFPVSSVRFRERRSVSQSFCIVDCNPFSYWQWNMTAQTAANHFFSGCVVGPLGWCSWSWPIS